jgi:hypothetical protein
MSQLKYTTYTPENVCHLHQITVLIWLSVETASGKHFLTGLWMVNLKGLAAVTNTSVYNMTKTPTPSQQVTVIQIIP